MSLALTGKEEDRDGPFWTPLRWGLCFAAIAAIHVCGVWLAMHRRPAETAVVPPPPAAAVMIDLAPLPVAPPARPREMPPGPKQALSAPPPPEPLAPPVLPPAPPTPAPMINVPLPPPAKPKPPKRHERVAVHESARPRFDNKPPAAATTAPPRVEAPPASAPAAPAPGASAAPSPNAVPTWQGLLLGRLERFKRYPAIAQRLRQQGVAALRFTMDRQGRVLSASIDKSSGFDSLDEEALALIHRAEPLPAPPPEVKGDRIELVVPVQFFLKK